MKQDTKRCTEGVYVFQSSNYLNSVARTKPDGAEAMQSVRTQIFHKSAFGHIVFPYPEKTKCETSLCAQSYYKNNSVNQYVIKTEKIVSKKICKKMILLISIFATAVLLCPVSRGHRFIDRFCVSITVVKELSFGRVVLQSIEQ